MSDTEEKRAVKIRAYGDGWAAGVYEAGRLLYIVAYGNTPEATEADVSRWMESRHIKLPIETESPATPGA